MADLGKTPRFTKSEKEEGWNEEIDNINSLILFNLNLERIGEYSSRNSLIITMCLSDNGDYAIYSTGFPENSIYLVDTKRKVVLWDKPNKSRSVIGNLEFTEDGYIHAKTEDGTFIP